MHTYTLGVNVEVKLLHAPILCFTRLNIVVVTCWNLATLSSAKFTCQNPVAQESSPLLMRAALRQSQGLRLSVRKNGWFTSGFWSRAPSTQYCFFHRTAAAKEKPRCFPLPPNSLLLTRCFSNQKIYTSLSISEKNRGLWIWETPMPFDCRTVASLWNTLENCFNYLAHSQQADANGVQIPDMHFQLKGYIWSPNIPTEPHQGLIHFAISLFGHLLVFLPPISTLSSPAMPCSKPDRQRVELLKAGGIRYCVHVFPK